MIDKVSSSDYILRIASNIAIWGAIIAGVLTLVDWFNPEMLKRILLIAAITVWNSVDDLKQFVFKICFDRGKRQLGLIAFSIVYAGIVLIYANYYGDSELHPPDISVVSINPDKIFSAIELFFAESPYLTTSSIITGIGIFITIVITTVPSIFRWLGRSKSQLGYMSRLFLIFILCGMPILFIAFGQPGINRLIRGYSHQTQLFIVIPAQAIAKSSVVSCVYQYFFSCNVYYVYYHCVLFCSIDNISA